MTRSISMAVVASLIAFAGCSDHDRFIALTITNIPPAATQLAVSMMLDGRTAPAEIFSIPKNVDKTSLGLRIPHDLNGALLLLVAALDGQKCELGASLHSQPFPIDTNKDTEEIPVQLAAPLTPMCNELRTPFMSRVYADTYVIGCGRATDANCDTDEGPARSIGLQTFDIDILEVTTGAYADCQAANACTAPFATSVRPAFAAQNGVTFAQASEYCAWVGKRLPTEAEWVAAARGKDTKLYPWGDDAPECVRANYEGCISTNQPYTTGISSVGVFNMAGNLAEWVQDHYAPISSLTDEQLAKGTAPGADGDPRVFKGGSFGQPAIEMRIAYRDGVYPDGHSDTFTAEQNLPYGGFRCAISR